MFNTRYIKENKVSSRRLQFPTSWQKEEREGGYRRHNIGFVFVIRNFGFDQDPNNRSTNLERTPKMSIKRNCRSNRQKLLFR